MTAPFNVGSRFTLTHRAPPNSTFADVSPFASSIGTVMPLKVADLALAAVKLVAAAVTDDGTSVELLFEVVAR